MEDPALSVYSEARNEYMKQLTQYLRQPFLNFFLEQLQVARDEMRDTPKKYLWQFQNRLKSIKEWNVDKVQTEITRIQMASNCDFLEELITAVFIAHTKVMTAIKISSRKSKVNITVPKLEHYLFKAICECSDLIWANAYLLRDDISPIDKQKNMRQVEALIIDGMQQAIRCLLPVKSILRDLVAEVDDDAPEPEEEPEVEAPVSKQEPMNEEVAEDTRHFENKKDDAPTGVMITKLPADELVAPAVSPVPAAPTEVAPADVAEPVPTEKQEIQTNVMAQVIIPAQESLIIPETPSMSETALENVQEPALENAQEPTIFQVDTSKKVQFTEYNMGFKDEDEVDTFVESMDDGLLIVDETEHALGENDFDTL
jgi:hypothetical protein